MWYSTSRIFNICSKLLDKGYKVGIVEQLEDPKLAKKLVERDVVQIITPGANLELKLQTIIL